MAEMVAGRVIVDAALAGPANMARDEALLDACRADSAPTLRFYAWARPTLSLGYFQDYAEYESLEPPAGGLPVVRRTTGGGAILHDLEVTYALVLPVDLPLIRDKPNHLYVIAHRAVVSTVSHGARMVDCRAAGPCGESARRGPFFCFARRHALDVLVPDPAGIDGYSKLTGSAQRRTRRAILQHGSIILDARFPQQPAATWSRVAGPIGFDEAVRRLVPAFEEHLGAALSPRPWTTAELEVAERLEAKYAGDDWTKSRRR
jgi:lipoate-protein ligase A